MGSADAILLSVNTINAVLTLIRENLTLKANNTVITLKWLKLVACSRCNVTVLVSIFDSLKNGSTIEHSKNVGNAYPVRYPTTVALSVDRSVYLCTSLFAPNLKSDTDST